MATQKIGSARGRFPWPVVVANALAVVLCLVVAGCGDSDTGNGPVVDPGTYDPPSQTVAVETGCTEDYPLDGLYLDAWLTAVVRLCRTADWHHALLTNISSWIITVAPGESTTLGQPTYSDESSVAALAAEGISTALNSDQTTYLPPGAAITADNPQSIARTLVGLDFVPAVEAWTVGTFGSYIQGKLQTRGQKFANSLAQCAQEVGTSWVNFTAPPADSMPLAALLADTVLGAGTTCHAMLSQVLAEAGEEVPPEATLSNEFGDVAKSFRTTYYADLRSALRNLLQATRG